MSQMDEQYDWKEAEIYLSTNVMYNVFNIILSILIFIPK